MLREIMVPLDGTSFAEAALPLGLSLAARDGARLRLVTVWRPLPPPEVKSSWEKERRMWQDEDRAQLEAYLDDTAAKASEAGVTAEVEVLEGGVDQVLPRWTASSDVDLVVMATHARNPVIRAWLGSAGDRIVREGRRPVLLVHPESEEPAVEIRADVPPRRIVVALDGSALAERALDASVLGGAKGSDVHLVLVRVVPHAVGTVPAYAPDAPAINAETLEALRKEAEEYLASVSERARKWAGSLESEVILRDAVPRAITELARDRAADLISMGTRGRGGVVRAVLGSVADKVLRTSEVPVLMFPPGEG